MYLFGGLIVAGLFLQHLRAVGFVEVDGSQIVLAHEIRSDGVLVSGHESVSHLLDRMVLPVGDILVDSVGIVVIFGVSLLFLDGVFVTPFQCASEVTLGQRHCEVDAFLPFVFLDALVGVAELVNLPFGIAKGGDAEGGVGLLLSHIHHRCAEVEVAAALEFQSEIALVGAVFGGTRVTRCPVHLQLAQEVFAIEGKVHGLLSLQSGILVVVRTGFGLQHDALVFGIAVQFLVTDAVAVLPVVAAVVDTLE